MPIDGKPSTSPVRNSLAHFNRAQAAPAHRGQPSEEDIEAARQSHADAVFDEGPASKLAFERGVNLCARLAWDKPDPDSARCSQELQRLSDDLSKDRPRSPEEESVLAAHAPVIQSAKQAIHARAHSILGSVRADWLPPTMLALHQRREQLSDGQRVGLARQLASHDHGWPSVEKALDTTFARLLAAKVPSGQPGLRFDEPELHRQVRELKALERTIKDLEKDTLRKAWHLLLTRMEEHPNWVAMSDLSWNIDKMSFHELLDAVRILCLNEDGANDSQCAEGHELEQARREIDLYHAHRLNKCGVTSPWDLRAAPQSIRSLPPFYEIRGPREAWQNATGATPTLSWPPPDAAAEDKPQVAPGEVQLQASEPFDVHANDFGHVQERSHVQERIELNLGESRPVPQSP